MSAPIKLLYATPEKLAKSVPFNTLLDHLHRQNALELIVIDEAHCVSQWGNSFRPDYLHLNVLKQRFPTVPMMALTATATCQVRQDIMKCLNLYEPVCFVQSVNRNN